jgi:hypothetical protein
MQHAEAREERTAAAPVPRPLPSTQPKATHTPVVAEPEPAPEPEPESTPAEEEAPQAEGTGLRAVALFDYQAGVLSLFVLSCDVTFWQPRRAS